MAATMPFLRFRRRHHLPEASEDATSITGPQLSGLRNTAAVTLHVAAPVKQWQIPGACGDAVRHEDE